MKVITDIEKFSPDANTVVTVGTFDGVHTGHIRIINKVKDDAERFSYKSVLFTFEPHPQAVLQTKPNKLRLLTTLDEKLEILSAHNLDYVVVQKFDYEFSQIPYQHFIEEYLLKRLRMKKMVLGYDAALGNKREGNLDHIQDHARLNNYSLDIVPPISVDNIVVNSTLIREYIFNGYLEKATKALGRYYDVRGIVIHGDGRGASLGYPTANLLLEHPLKLMPPVGVYAVDVVIDGHRYKGMMNIGTRPTFHDNEEHEVIAEVHVLDFEGELYKKQITVFFKQMIRKEKKFNSVDELIQQLKLDEKFCRKID